MESGESNNNWGKSHTLAKSNSKALYHFSDATTCSLLLDLSALLSNVNFLRDKRAKLNELKSGGSGSYFFFIFNFTPQANNIQSFEGNLKYR